ncbi:MAG: hypothetical protein M3Y87_05655 [Myxococcota bacterium]|nr:hypothetical protein [Myxococcota bacterium]
MTDGVVHEIVDGKGPLVRRRIVAWRRLEPGDVRTPGSIDVPESPFLEAKLFEIGVPAEVHAEMKRLAAAKTKATAIPSSPLTEYEPAGILISAAGGIAVGVWLEYLRPETWFNYAAMVLGAIGVVLAVVAKQRRRAAEAEADARWSAMPEKKEYESLAREVAQGWVRFTQTVKKDAGFHVEIRVAEGSSDPLRLASIDPRPMVAARGFDPEDWMPTEGGGVRYEALHTAGEIATRLLPGTTEAGELAAPEPETKSAPSDAAPEPSADTTPAPKADAATSPDAETPSTDLP